MPLHLTARRLSLLGAVALMACAPRARTPRDPALPGGPGLAMRAYRDPVSGAFGAPPAGAGVSPLAAATPRPTLSETRAPGGGTMVQLGGAFRSHVVARAAVGGTSATCGPTAAP